MVSEKTIWDEIREKNLGTKVPKNQKPEREEARGKETIGSS